jgi:hypothetical protein
MTNSVISSQLKQYLLSNWEFECEKKRPSLLKAIARAIYTKILCISIFTIIEETSFMVQPILIAYITKYFSDDISLRLAILFGVIICLSIFSQFMSTHRSFFLLYQCGMQLRVALSALIYEKVSEILAYSLFC